MTAYASLLRQGRMGGVSQLALKESLVCKHSNFSRSVALVTFFEPAGFRRTSPWSRQPDLQRSMVIVFRSDISMIVCRPPVRPTPLAVPAAPPAGMCVSQ